ncbi:MAG TPA: cupredoxin family copper-binding protein [Bacteroidales bacterium]|nr:cupredoxin family copper-binding protein [Bacteroidales bacterium]
MKNIISAAIFSLFVILSSCSDKDEDVTVNNPNTNPPASNEVSIRTSSFNPAVLTVTAGITVKWTNNDNMEHTVTSDQGLFNSGTIPPKGTFVFTFPAAGTYTYYCEIHPFMKGTVVVR